MRTNRWRIYEDNAQRRLRRLAPRCAGAVITDPPYGIGFMKQEWDRFDTQGEHPGRRYQEWTSQWAAAARGATLPGTNWLVFAAPRNMHRTACGLEDAGLEIFDCILWIYGQGLPKSHPLAKGIGTSLKPAFEAILVARTPSPESAEETYRKYGTVGLRIDDCRIDGEDGSGHWSGENTGSDHTMPGYRGGWDRGGTRQNGRWPANLVLSEPAASELDHQAGTRRSGGPPKRRSAEKHTPRVYSGGFPTKTVGTGRGTTWGTPSRFFYCPKAGPEDRTECADGGRILTNTHACVKPLDLMRWLVRLASDPRGTVLDPFTGTGTTGLACAQEGRSFIGIEQDPENARTARERLRSNGA